MTRRALALPAVLFMTAMIGALVVGSAFLGRSAASGARVTRRAAGAAWPAESALVETLVRWDSSSRVAQPIGQTVAESSSEVSVAITRLGPALYLCAATYSGQLPYRLGRRLSVLVVTDSAGARPIPDLGWTVLP
jgi:hypothetical protein